MRISIQYTALYVYFTRFYRAKYLKIWYIDVSYACSGEHLYAFYLRASMEKILITRPIPEEGISLLREAGHEVEVWDKSSPMSREEFLAAITDATALVTSVTERIDAEALAAAPHLKIVANYRSHYDNFDIWAATQRGVALTYVPLGVQDSMAEFTIGVIIALARQITQAHEYLEEGHYKRWEPMIFLGTELKGKTLGLVGFGKVGRRVGEIANVLGMHVVYADEENKKVSFPATRRELPELLAESDVVSIHLPPLPTTNSLISAKEMRMMKEGAFLINTSRGMVIDETSLVQHLRSGRLAGAALDVLQCETLQDCSPSDHAELKGMENVLLTPQISSSTKEARTFMSITVAESILQHLSGKKPEYIINPEVFE